jgi:hypothetical protein
MAGAELCAAPPNGGGARLRALKDDLANICSDADGDTVSPLMGYSGTGPAAG